MSTKANAEQLLAIEHSGGVLLSAGAGSGKTFVLKEHLIYLCRNWIKDFQISHDDSFAQFIKSRLRKIVMMTFTNKAAGELEIRLRMEIENLCQIDADSDFWKTILENLDYLNISTIHGFCLKLIRQGFFASIPADTKIVSDAQYKKFLSDIFDEWLCHTSYEQNDLNRFIVLKNKKHILKALYMIFSDPSVRIMWGEAIEYGIKINDCNSHIVGLFEELNFVELWQDPPLESTYADFKKNKWSIFLEEFILSCPRFDGSIESVLAIIGFFSFKEYKIPPKPSGKKVPFGIIAYYEKIRDLKDFLKKNEDSFVAFKNDFQNGVQSWHQTLSSIVQYIEYEYGRLEGVTFSDLEYYVYQGLRDKDVVKRIYEEYHYFIIDEFQDTSYIQFSILQKMIEENYSRLFCVGDPKQAIYGFRGGEVGVFLDCQKHVGKNLQLKNNYRSSQNVINFNNNLFDFLFHKGVGFKGEDKMAIHVDAQHIPKSDILMGEVKALKYSLDFRENVKEKEDKISNAEVDLLEALAIFKKVSELKKAQQRSAILYKRLRPSLFLIDLLIKNNIGFTAQIKIPFLEDPINGIFFELIQSLKDTSDNSREYLIYILNAYLTIINQKTFDKVTSTEVEEFENDLKYFGLYIAFSRFLENCSLYNSNFSNNLNFINQAIISTSGNIDKLLLLLKENRDSSYSLDFQFGLEPDKVILMSAHASKGLQFENVLLGGIYTNDSSIPNNSPVGKIPMSFKWSSELSGKKMLKTPSYIYEEIINRKKEFSESKRLFYVANTRAERALYFVDLEFGSQKRSRSQSGSWINGLEIWKEESLSFIAEEFVSVEDLYDEAIGVVEKTIPPLFHTDDLGIGRAPKDKFILLPELSVTKLALIAFCPRRFYLENICKISEEDIKKNFPPKEFENSDFFGEKNSVFKSSSERGTILHNEISQMINSNFKAKVKQFDQSIRWIVEKLRLYVEKYDLLSEKQIKFELFSYMLSGIPDLILLAKDKNEISQIWDFKTGLYDESKLSIYDFQLNCYACALFFLGKVDSQSPIKLVLCFIDEQRNVERIVYREDVENYLQKYFLDLNHPHKQVASNCSKCHCKVICQK